MSRMLNRIAVETLVDHAVVEIIDDAGQQPPLPDFSAVDRWLYVRDNCVMLISATGHEHDAHVALELWESEPPQPAGSWEAGQDARLRLASGLLELDPTVAGADAEALEVGPPGEYRLRAWVAGRAELARLAQAAPDRRPPSGVERFLVQLWPDPGGAVDQYP
jgi:hypothetical protein